LFILVKERERERKQKKKSIILMIDFFSSSVLLNNEMSCNLIISFKHLTPTLNFEIIKLKNVNIHFPSLVKN